MSFVSFASFFWTRPKSWNSDARWNERKSERERERREGRAKGEQRALSLAKRTEKVPSVDVSRSPSAIFVGQRLLTSRKEKREPSWLESQPLNPPPRFLLSFFAIIRRESGKWPALSTVRKREKIRDRGIVLHPERPKTKRLLVGRGKEQCRVPFERRCKKDFSFVVAKQC